jgi:hypothetical protein
MQKYFSIQALNLFIFSIPCAFYLPRFFCMDVCVYLVFGLAEGGIYILSIFHFFYFVFAAADNFKFALAVFVSGFFFRPLHCCVLHFCAMEKWEKQN